MGISRQRHSERGQSRALMAGLLVVLLGMAAFVVDLGNAYFFVAPTARLQPMQRRWLVLKNCLSRIPRR